MAQKKVFGPPVCQAIACYSGAPRFRSDYVTLDVMIEPILLNTLFTVVVRPGIAATAATATMPAASAYSTKSCPRQSFQTLSIELRFLSHFIFVPSLSWRTMKESARLYSSGE